MNSPVASKEDVTARLRSRAADLERLGVRRLGLFGSILRGSPRPESDVDVLVEFGEGEKSFDRYMELSVLLEDLLGRPVELVTRDALSPYIGPHILEEVEYVEIGR